MSNAYPPPTGPLPRPEEDPAAALMPVPEPPLPGISLGSVHCCPYCGAPVAVVSVLMPVEQPPDGGGG